MRRFLVILLGLLCMSTQLLAQNRTVSGKVTDENGKPIANVSVQVKNSQTGTTTNEQGHFSLSLPANAKVLVFSSVGSSSKEVTIGSGSTFNVSLESVESSMQEVVVTGYGTGRKLSTQTGSVANVNGKTLQDRPTANAFDALQGKVAGLQVFTSSGEPSQLSSLRIHGVGSLGASSTPLYIMDGIPIDAGTVISLNPNDFESVTVLKDASATSIYGSRAANGVIVISTKRGSANKPASFTFEQQYGISNLAYTKFYENFMNRKELSDFFVQVGQRRRGQMDTTLAQYPADTKWYKYYYNDNVPMYQTDLSVSGGGGKTSYYISGGYINQEGLAYRSGFKRYSMRSNLNTAVNNWMKLGMNLFFESDKRRTNPYGSNNLNRGLAMLAAPWFSPYDSTGTEYYGQIPGLGLNTPKYLTDKIYSNSQNIQFNPSGYIELTPFKNFTLKTQGGIEAYDYTTSSGTLPSYNNTFSGNSNEAFTRGITRTITNTAEYKFHVGGNHNFTALAGQEFIDNVTKAFNAGAQGLTDDRLIMLSSGTTGYSAGSSKSEFSYLSYFSRLEYNFMNRYFVDGSFRQDQSSRFGVDNRTANFWAVGAKWRAKSESFLSNIKWLTDLSLRGSIGTTGNSAIGNYDNQALVGTTSYEGISGWGVSQPGNPLLGWESQLQTTVGVDANLFNRVNITLDYYNRVTKDMLVAVPYPFTTGFSSITSNVGSLKNSGVDLAISADVVKGKDYYVTPYVSLNYNKQEVTELFQGKQYWIIPNTGVSWAVGQPVSFFYPVFAQVNPQTGLPEWYKPNADPNLIVVANKDPKDVTSTFSATALQQNTGIKRYAPFNGGFGFNGGYKGIFIGVDFTFSQGKYLINNDRYFFENPNQFPGYNQSRSVLNYWKQAGDVTQFPKYGVQFTQFDSRLIEDASFMRLKGLTLGYVVPQNVVNKTHIVKGAKVFFTGRNLWTTTKYTGPDPEVDSNLSLGVNPNTKQVAFGVEVKF